MSGKFKLQLTKGGKYMWNLHAPNGEVILTSQSYASKHGAKNGIECVKSCAAATTAFEQKAGKSGQDYFVMKGRNGRVIGRSEMYKSNRSLNGGISSVRKNATRAAIEDLTRR